MPALRPASSGFATISASPIIRPACRRETGAPVICLYVLDETAPAPLRPLGGAARWWLAQSLRGPARRPELARRDLVLPRALAKVIADLARRPGRGGVLE